MNLLKESRDILDQLSDILDEQEELDPVLQKDESFSEVEMFIIKDVATQLIILVKAMEFEDAKSADEKAQIKNEDDFKDSIEYIKEINDVGRSIIKDYNSQK